MYIYFLHTSASVKPFQVEGIGYHLEENKAMEHRADVILSRNVNSDGGVIYTAVKNRCDWPIPVVMACYRAFLHSALALAGND